MGKCQIYLHDHPQTFTDIRALKIMNMYQILSIYLITNKNYGQKTGGPSNLERPIGYLCPRVFGHNLFFSRNVSHVYMQVS
jgi:hypothetical protein